MQVDPEKAEKTLLVLIAVGAGGAVAFTLFVLYCGGCLGGKTVDSDMQDQWGNVPEGAGKPSGTKQVELAPRHSILVDMRKDSMPLDQQEFPDFDEPGNGYRQ